MVDSTNQWMGGMRSSVPFLALSVLGHFLFACGGATQLRDFQSPSEGTPHSVILSCGNSAGARFLANALRKQTETFYVLYVHQRQNNPAAAPGIDDLLDYLIETKTPLATASIRNIEDRFGPQRFYSSDLGYFLCPCLELEHLVALLGHFGAPVSNAPQWSFLDFNDDGLYDLADLAVILSNYGNCTVI